MQRYARITGKRKREIVLLKGGPCRWGRCAFCDYISDNEPDETACNTLNRSVLSRVTGEFGKLEVINSGNVFELPEETMFLLRETVRRTGLKQLCFECHWSYREQLDEIRSYFGIPVLFKCGVETFDADFRNRVLKKGMVFSSPQEVARYFDCACLLVGVQGQTKEMIRRDIDLLLRHFPYGCVNLYQNNTTPIRRDESLIRWFCEAYRFLEDDERIDVLFENTDFGVGEVSQ